MNGQVTAFEKECPCSETIEFMLGALRKRRIEVEEASSLNPLPGVWSLHLRSKIAPGLFSNGKGISREAALASALGEFIERLSCNYFFADIYLPAGLQMQRDYCLDPREKWFPVTNNELPAGIMDDNLNKLLSAAIQLQASELLDFNFSNHERGILTLPFKRLTDNKEVYIPVNLLDNLYVSNGMAAGNSAPEAAIQALSEIIERYVKNKIIATGMTLPDIPEAHLAPFPHIATAISSLRANGFAIWVKDASLGGQFPVINITLASPESRGFYAAFGAHPIFRVAVERTLTELLQGRDLDCLPDFPRASFDLDEVATTENLEEHFVDSTGSIHFCFISGTPSYPFTAWDFSGSRAEQYEYLTRLISASGSVPYVCEFNHLGVNCCRIVVPGMSEIYPVDDLINENKNSANSLRNALLNLHQLTSSELQGLCDDIEAAGYFPDQSVASLIGILPALDSPWNQLLIGELKALLALACRNWDEAKQWSEWSSRTGRLSCWRQQVYHCVYNFLAIKIVLNEPAALHKHTLQAIFKAEIIVTAECLIDGKTPFFDLKPIDFKSAEFAPHAQLMEIFNRRF